MGGRALELAFLGGATTVTGSQFLLTTDRARVLVDCGMFQGSPNEVTRNRLPFAFAPREVDALLLTHAHLDHCGLIPALVADGFAGPIYATAGTVELAGLVLLDAAKLEFAKRSERRARRQHPPTSDPEAELRAQGPWVETAHEEPLYTEADVMSALARFRGEREARRRRGLPAHGLHHARRPARRDRARAEGPRARIRDERRAMARDGDAGLGDRALRERGGEEHLV
ncbi:MAG: MBL fold metallo-hydrolase, partial [Chloroflexi bacterium]